MYFEKIETVEQALKVAEQAKTEGLQGLYPKALQVIANKFKEMQGDIEEILLECDTDCLNDEPEQIEGCWIVDATRMTKLATEADINIQALLESDS